MKRGWCPTVHEPMPAGDGLLVRVKPPGSRLDASAVRVLADASARFGNGVIELTSRANLHIRGLSEAGAPAFAAAMVTANLASADAAVERRRTVMAAPLAGDDPAAADARPLAHAIEAMLAAEPALAALPAKFGFAVDGGGARPLSVTADIAVRTDGARHWIVLADAAAACAPDATIGIARVLALRAGGRRMRERDAACVLADAGLVPEPWTRPAPLPAVGFIAYPGTVQGAFGFGLPFGQTDAATLRVLGELSAIFGDGVLRLTPWRAILVASRAGDAAALRHAGERAGMIVDAGDRRLRVAACIGSAGCARGTTRTRDDAALLSTADWRGVLHVSGCGKGCAHPGAAAVTLVARGGAYDLVRDGRAGDVAARTALTLTDARRAAAA